MSDKVTLRDPRPTKTLELPSFPGSKVEIWPSLLAQDIQVAAEADGDIKKGIASLVRLIKSWNFTDDKGVDLPVHEVELGKLPASDLTFLFDEITKFSAEQKKS